MVPVGGPRDAGDLVGDREAVDLDRRLEPLARDLRRPAGDRLVRGGDHPRRQLHVHLDRGLVVALVGHADVEPRDPPGAAAGWTVTWAPAAAGGARAMSRAAVAAIGVRMGSFT